jgi:hypothetical protein
MNSNCVKIVKRGSVRTDEHQPDTTKRTETFYGVRYSKEELNIIWKRIYESKLMASEWIRRRMLADL